MSVLLHHVSLVSTDPERSAQFYQSMFGLTRLDWPPMRMLVNRSGMAGFLQLYVMDPDRNIIEVNTAN